MTAVDRPRSVLARITEGQYLLLKKKVEATPHMTTQRLLTAAINAYIRGDFIVYPDGSYTVGTEALIFEGDDDEALDIDMFAEDPLESDDVQTWGTRELIDYTERMTGKSINKRMLLVLLGEKYPQEFPRGGRYQWQTDDPTVREIVEDIRGGALERIRDRRMASFGAAPISASPK